MRREIEYSVKREKQLRRIVALARSFGELKNGEGG